MACKASSRTRKGPLPGRQATGPGAGALRNGRCGGGGICAVPQVGPRLPGTQLLQFHPHRCRWLLEDGGIGSNSTAVSLRANARCAAWEIPPCVKRAAAPLKATRIPRAAELARHDHAGSHLSHEQSFRPAHRQPRALPSRGPMRPSRRHAAALALLALVLGAGLADGARNGGPRPAPKVRVETFGDVQASGRQFDEAC